MINLDLSDFVVSTEEKKPKHVIEVHYRDLKEDKYVKEKMKDDDLAKLTHDAIEFINKQIKDKESELKFVGFPSHKG